MADEDALVEAVHRLRVASDGLTAAEIHAALASEGSSASLAEVKKACSKASKRFKVSKPEPTPTPVLSKKKREAMKWATDAKPESLEQTLAVVSQLASNGQTDRLEAAIDAGWLSGRSPAERAALFEGAMYQGRPLLYALEAGQMETVTYLLGRPTDFPVDEMTGFVWRVAGSPDVTTIATPLHFVCCGGVPSRKWKFIELLVDAGASPVAERSHDGTTPLLAVAKCLATAGTVVDDGADRSVQQSDEYADARACLVKLLRKVQYDPAMLGRALHYVLSPSFALAMDAAVMLLEAGADPTCFLSRPNSITLIRVEALKSKPTLSLAQYLIGEQFWKSNFEFKDSIRSEFEGRLSDCDSSNKFTWGHLRVRTIPDLPGPSSIVTHAPDELLVRDSFFYFIKRSEECEPESLYLLNPLRGLAIEAVDRTLVGPISPDDGPIRFQQRRPGLWVVVRVEKVPWNVCATCGSTSEQLKSCDRCERVRYCSSKCQKSNWKVHKHDCNFFAPMVGTTAGEDRCVSIR